MSNFKLLFFAAIVFGMVTAGPSFGQNSESSGITWSFDDGNETAVSADKEPPLQPVVPEVEFAAEPLLQGPLPSSSLETPKDPKQIAVQEIQKEISMHKLSPRWKLLVKAGPIAQNSRSAG